MSFCVIMVHRGSLNILGLFWGSFIKITFFLLNNVFEMTLKQQYIIKKQLHCCYYILNKSPLLEGAPEFTGLHSVP